MDTGRLRGKHMKLSLTKFLLDVNTKQDIQGKDKCCHGVWNAKNPQKDF